MIQSTPNCFIVALPAHDESERIAGALRTLDTAAAETRIPVSVLLLANDCRDDTAMVARRVADSLDNSTAHIVEETLPARLAHAGGARRRTVSHALSRFGTGSGDVLFSTDADARLRRDAFSKMEAAFSDGAELVLAKIECIHDPLDPVSDEALAGAGLASFGVIASVGSSRRSVTAGSRLVPFMMTTAEPASLFASMPIERWEGSAPYLSKRIWTSSARLIGLI